MLKKTITYQNYNDEIVVEDCYFNLSKSEIAEMEYSIPGGLSNHLQKIVKDSDMHAMMDVLKRLILDSYGKKSDDGKRFIKSESLKTEFYQSEAYSSLFIELAQDPSGFETFLRGILPQDLQGPLQLK